MKLFGRALFPERRLVQQVEIYQQGEFCELILTTYLDDGEKQTRTRQFEGRVLGSQWTLNLQASGKTETK